MRCQQNHILSRLHNVRTEKQDKVALSPNDDKRFLLPDTTDTLPWSRYNILNKDDKELLDILMQLEEEGEWGDSGEEGEPIIN